MRGPEPKATSIPTTMTISIAAAVAASQVHCPSQSPRNCRRARRRRAYRHQLVVRNLCRQRVGQLRPQTLSVDRAKTAGGAKLNNPDQKRNPNNTTVTLDRLDVARVILFLPIRFQKKSAQGNRQRTKLNHVARATWTAIWQANCY